MLSVEIQKAGVSNSFSLKIAFERLQFLDRLVWTIDEQIKPHLQNYSELSYFSLGVGSHALEQEQGGSCERQVGN